MPGPRGTNIEQPFLPPEFDDAWRVAVHEAAHAVAGLSLGRGVVEIWTDGETGWCKPRGVTPAVACLCVFVAEWGIDHPGEIPTADDFRRNGDKPDARRVIARLGSADPDLLRAVRFKARRLIDDNWDACCELPLNYSSTAGCRASKLGRSCPGNREPRSLASPLPHASLLSRGRKTICRKPIRVSHD
jgi:hypothetical protein